MPALIDRFFDAKISIPAFGSSRRQTASLIGWFFVWAVGIIKAWKE
jgi:hypothetical protein